jgi:transposase
MTIVADIADAVLGIDTHRDAHQVEIAHPTGTPIATTSIRNSDAGFVELIGWITDHSPGPNVFIGIEGSRSYGIGLARALTGAGFTVIETEQPSRKNRRGKGKSDPIDAHLAVLHARSCDVDRLPTPRADGDREALRILLVAREDISTAHTAATNRCKALLLTGDDHDRDLARGALTLTKLTVITRRRVPAGADRAQTVRRGELRRLAANLREHHHALSANRQQLLAIVTDLAPALLTLYGVGPVSAAAVIIAFSHHGRCRNDAAFAALAGTNPIPASSGLHQRHRLNRGGDRQLNRAIHTIALTRSRGCQRTRAYITRRSTENKSPREIRRCLKRYITRELFRTLNTNLAT